MDYEAMYNSIGPEKIIELYDPETGMKGFVCLDSMKRGPAKGGVRMRPDVTKEEVFRLARAMSLKCAMADLPFGGGKSGIVANAKELTPEKKEAMVRAFGKAIKNLAPAEYVAAPDMNMPEETMRWIAEANGNKQAVTGKPADLGGIPHELGSTGFGVYHATLVALEHMGKDIKGTTFALEGFGNVGEFAAKFLIEKGAKLIAVSDSKGVIVNKDGFKYEKLKATKKEQKTVTKYGVGEVLDANKLLDVEADILVTAAIKDLIKAEDTPRLKFSLIVEGSNIPMRHDLEEALHKKGILIIPDFVANAGGVISSYVEFKGGTVDEMWQMVEEKIVSNTKKVLAQVRPEGNCPRCVANAIAEKRIVESNL